MFGRPILYLQTCLAVPGWPCFAVLTVPKMLFGLGAGLLLYWHIPECKLCSKYVLGFFGFGWLNPSMKPLLPLRVSHLRSSGESSGQPLQTAGVREVADTASVS